MTWNAVHKSTGQRSHMTDMLLCKGSMMLLLIQVRNYSECTYFYTFSGCGSELHNNSVCTQLPVTYLVLKGETGVIKTNLKMCEPRTFLI